VTWDIYKVFSCVITSNLYISKDITFEMEKIMTIADPIKVQEKVNAGSLADLKAKGKKIFKHGKKQILLLHREGKVYACNNRCPHEGYPLAEGTLAETCTLTCNWHNWKFDLTSGETLVGGDVLRQYPVEIKAGEIILDVTDPPAEERIPKIMADLEVAMDDYDYDRIARELARMKKVGGNTLEPVRKALSLSHDKFEYGMGHSYAAAADWLTLRQEYLDDEAKDLICLVEPVAHMAWDTLREDTYPYTDTTLPFDPDELVSAIEVEDETKAVALCLGALEQGMAYKDIEPALARAALAHYQAFGHSAIYVHKIGELTEHLGQDSLKPALLGLLRHLIYARREDLIPEFRQYASNLEAWTGGGDAAVSLQDFTGLSVNKAMARAQLSSANPENLYQALLGTSAWNYLHFDLSFQNHTTQSISSNIDWLDFTHTMTFANAVRTLCTRYPELWPQGLLQMACFVGRNTPFIDKDLDTSSWQADATPDKMDVWLEGLFDHAQFEHIVSSHLIKTATAIKEEVVHAPNAPFVPLAIAAHNRFLSHGIKRRHVIRSANQALEFVARED
jgi:nitrite reductase/ring-hydroxylating ferredoxin subunit